MPRTLEGFAGFTPGALDFLTGLAADNSRAYFDANRAVYEREVREPAKALVAELGEELRTRVDPRIGADPARGLFRINRDTRFSKDKTPYKTHVAMGFPLGGGRSDSPALYLSVAPTHVGTGVGFAPPDVDVWRAAVAGEESGGAFATALAAAEAAGGEPMDLGEPALKRVPRGYPPDHPLADWLRRKGIRLGHRHAAPAEAHGPEMVAWAADRLTAYAPMLRWLDEHVTGAC